MSTASPLQDFEHSIALILALPELEQRELLEHRFAAGDHPTLALSVRVGAVRALPAPRRPNLDPDA